MKTKMEVVVMEFRLRKWKGFLSFIQLRTWQLWTCLLAILIDCMFFSVTIPRCYKDACVNSFLKGQVNESLMNLIYQKTQLDCCLVWRNQRGFSKIKMSSLEYITQHKSSVCDFKARKVKVTRKKIWKLYENSIKSDCSSYMHKYKASSQKDASAESSLDFLKVVLLEITNWIFGWTKDWPVIKKPIGAMIFNSSVSEVHKLWKE